MKYGIIITVASLLLIFTGCSQNKPGYVIWDDSYSLSFRISNDEKGFIADIKKESAAMQGDKRKTYLQEMLLKTIDNDYRAAVLTLIELGVDINCDLTEDKEIGEPTLYIKGWPVQYGSPVEYAALQGKVLFLDLYLNGKISTPVDNSEVSKLFNYTIEAERLEFVKFLIRSGFGPKEFIWDKIGYSEIQDKRIFKLLLDNGLHPNLYSRPSGGKRGYGGHAGKEPIFFRVREPEIVKMMIDYGADVNMLGRYRQTFLHTAIITGRKDLIATLLNNGANVNAADENGDTPLLLLYKTEYFDFEGFGYVKQENYYRIPRYGSTDLYKYRKRRKELGILLSPIGQCLIFKGANVNYKNKNDGLTALHYAAALQNISEIHFLIKNGANINARDNKGNTLLHIAAMHNLDESYIKQLIDCGADVTIKNNNGNTPQDILAKWKTKAN